MKSLKSAIFLFLSLVVISCSSSNVELAKKINNDPAMQGQEVELTGKINTKFEMFFTGTSKTWDVNFETVNAMNNQETEWVQVRFNYAKSTPNSIFIDLPKGETNYKSTDLKIYDKDGKEFTSKESIKIKGKVSKEGNTVTIVDVTIEQD